MSPPQQQQQQSGGGIFWLRPVVRHVRQIAAPPGATCAY